MIDNPLTKALGKASRPQYEQASTWAADIHGALRASRRLAWIVAGVAVAVAALEAIALAALAPLKSVVPYTILVDKQTGYAESIKGLEPGRISQDSAVTQSFIVQYVQARETFDATDLRNSYRKVSLWSAGEARTGYQKDMERGNPASPLNVYPASSTLSTTIKSVSFLSPTTALIRFDTTRHDAGSIAGEQRSWAAVMTFRYTNAAMSMDDRFVNPLGFQVVRYRRDAETIAGTPVMLPLAPPVATSTAAPPVVTGPATAPTVTPNGPPPAVGFPNLIPRP